MASRNVAASLLLLPVATAVSAETGSTANPIRKVVTMLQEMQVKVTEEGKQQEKLFEQFMCYCKNSGGDLDASITEAEQNLVADRAAHKASVERKAQTEADLKEHQNSRAEATETMAKAKALREKEAKEFAQVKSDAETNIAAITKAVAALSQGMKGGFLQTQAAVRVRSFVMEHANLSDGSREELLAFLSGTTSEGYAPASGEILGMLKTMGDEMKKDLADATTTENEAIANYKALMAAKRKEIATLQGQIEAEMERIGRLGMEVVELANGIEDTTEALAEDTKFKQELATSCSTKTAEWEEIKKTRAEELVALSETIKVLNDDDALELFKKTLPSPGASLLQVRTPARSQRAHALALIQSAAEAAKNPGLDLIALALRGKGAGFGKVISLIDCMMSNLKKEQADDDAKMDYCKAELAKTEDKMKEQKDFIDGVADRIDVTNGEIEKVKAAIKALKEGIAALDKSVAEATAQRKKENEEYKALMPLLAQSKEVLGWAKNRLNKFYKPSLYQPAPKREMEGDAFVQIKAHSSREAPPPAPEVGGYSKKGQQTNGVLAMIDLLVSDLEKQMDEATFDEKAAQKAYEKLMADARDKRAADSKLLEENLATLADLQDQLNQAKDKLGDDTKDLKSTEQYSRAIHQECDWLVKYYHVRKEARSSEIDSLKNAKAVLNGADYSFAQQSVSRGFLAKHMQ